MTRFSQGLIFRLLLAGMLAGVGSFALDKSQDGKGKGLITKAAEGIKKGAEAVVEGAKIVAEETAEGAEIVAEETVEGAEVVAEETVEGAKAVGKGAKEGAKTVIKGVKILGRKVGGR